MMEFYPTFNFRNRFKSDVVNWHRHFNFGFDLIRCLKPKSVVELGVHKGDSYFCFCESIKQLSLDSKCYGIDTWKGDQHSGNYEEEVYLEVERFNTEFYANFSYLVRDRFESAINQFSSESIDLLHIDGCHTYEAVSNDFNTWIKKVKTNGIILIHDINIRHKDFGAWRLWEELQKDFPNISFNFGCGLGVILNNQGAKHFRVGDFLLRDCAMPFISEAYSICYEKISLEEQLEDQKFKSNEMESKLNFQLENSKIQLQKLNEENSNLTVKSQFLKEKNDSLKKKCEAKNDEIKKIKRSKKMISKAREILETKFNLLSEQKRIESEETNREIIAIKNSNSLLADKVKRMTNSFSWKVSSPLRYLRRICESLAKFNDKDCFDPEFYLSFYADIRNELGSDHKKAYRHYLDYGKKEGRSANAKQLSESKSIEYTNWVNKYDCIDLISIKEFEGLMCDLEKQPLISIIMPIYKTETTLLKKAIDSVLNQIYQNWELCIVDDFSNDPEITDLVELYLGKDRRIKFRQLDENKNISAATNEGIKIAKGDFIGFLDHDDELRDTSLLHIAVAVNSNPNVKLIYTDEDKIDMDGNRMDPFFKPDWNPDLILSQNYICHLLCIEKKILNDAGGFDKTLSGCQDWDIILRVTELITDDQIVHIPKILYHWRKTKESTASNISHKNDVVSLSRRSLENCLKRRSINANIEIVGEGMNYFHIKRRLPSEFPGVSILIPTRDNRSILKKCVESILQNTDYPNYEVIIIDNESKKIETKKYFEEIKNLDVIRVIEFKEEFNYSKINNFAVQQTDSDVVILLNDDTEIISTFWLRDLVSNCIRDDIGCVGPKLLYPNDTIQHAGIVLGIGGVAGHQGKGEKASSTVNFSRLNVSHNCSAVTGACLAVKRKVYLEVGGLDEKNLKVAFNDVDFCLRIDQLGYRNLYLPYVRIYHHESFSRGSDKSKVNKNRFQNEITYMVNKWGSLLKSDPYYNPNLTLLKEDFSLSFPPRCNDIT